MLAMYATVFLFSNNKLEQTKCRPNRMNAIALNVIYEDMIAYLYGNVDGKRDGGAGCRSITTVPDSGLAGCNTNAARHVALYVRVEDLVCMR